MKTTCYIHARWNEFEKKYEFNCWPHDMTRTQNFGALIETQELEFYPPPHEVLVSGTIAQYREMQKQIAGEAEAKRSALEQKINDLLCLDYKPAEFKPAEEMLGDTLPF